MDTRLFLLTCLCLVAKVYGAAYGEACNQDTDCSGDDPLTKCDTSDTNKCVCDDTHVRDSSACKVPAGETCTGNDVTLCVSNTECPSGTCNCLTSYKTDGSAYGLCVMTYDSVCVNNGDCTPSLTHSKCKDDAGTMKCRCDDGYKVDGTAPKTCISVIGSTCTANTDCSGVTDAECPTGDTRTCTCKAGYMGAAGVTVCTKRKIADTCENDGDCSAAVTNSYCHDDSGTKTCMCSNGYEGAAAAVTCAKIYDKTCSNDAGCTGLKYGKCTATKCACNDDAVLEMNVCKLQIGKDCAGEYICPSNSACTGGKCTCSSNYVEKEDKCEATNSGMAVMASLMLIVTALASVLLR